MTATEQEIRNIFEWLESTKHVTVNNEWLEACISWLKSRGNLNMQLKDDVYEQWLMSDLSESGSYCLPDQISTLPSTSIQGVVALQMNSIVNIGASAYSQLKKLKNEVNENTSVDENRNQPWQPKPCRMLKLELTDGEQTIEGMEYQPMRKLSTGLIPGTKILINAGTLCKSGMLFLTDDNIEILGGPVQNLIEDNSQLNILNQLVRNAKEGKNVNNDDPRQNQIRSNNNRINGPQGQEQTTQHFDDDDFEALLRDEEILAELDGNMDPVEINGHNSPAEMDDNINNLLNIDDDIPEDVLDNLHDVENNANSANIRAFNASHVEWQIHDDDDFW